MEFGHAMDETVETMVGLSSSKSPHFLLAQEGTVSWIFFANTYLNNDNCAMSYLKRLDVSAAQG